MRARAGTTLAVVGVTLGLAAAGGGLPAQAATPGPCAIDGSSCRHVTVPLDRSGRVPGQVRLLVQRFRGARPARPPVLVFASAPGVSALREQFSPDFAGAGPSGIERYFLGHRPKPRRDLVVVDLRGTGGSGALRCSTLPAGRLDGSAQAAAECAASLGPAASHYSLPESIADVEAVRRALRIRRFALFGDGFGASLALAYARRHPARVERMVLHAPWSAGAVDPFFRAGMRAAPRLLDGLCPGRRCPKRGRDALDDLRALASGMQGGPLAGTVVTGDGTRQAASVDVYDLFYLLASGGVDPFLLAQLPGDIRGAAKGDPAPLLRDAATGPSGYGVRTDGDQLVASGAAAAAQICQSADLPWRRGASPTERTAGIARFAARRPASDFGPFGRAAARAADVVELCRGWPAAGRVPPPRRRIPRVPTLVLAGAASLTAAPSVARDLARRIPGAKLRVFGGYWADPFFADPTGCISGLVDTFLDRKPIGRERCNPSYLSVSALPEAPSSLEGVVAVGAPGNPGRTLAAARLTARDGLWALTRQVPSEPPAAWTAGALREGSYAYSAEDLERGPVTFSLRAASYVPGVTVSGQITFGRYQEESSGRLEVGGPAAAAGILDLRGSKLTGTLGGVAVRTSLSDDFLFDFGVSNGY